MNNKKGITIISLVITVIVLLILAGVTLSLTLGNNGIFKTAKKAAENYTSAQEKELAELNQFENTFLGLAEENTTGSTENGTNMETSSDLNEKYVALKQQTDELKQETENLKQETKELKQQLTEQKSEIQNSMNSAFNLNAFSAGVSKSIPYNTATYYFSYTSSKKELISVSGYSGTSREEDLANGLLGFHVYDETDNKFLLQSVIKASFWENAEGSLTFLAEPGHTYKVGAHYINNNFSYFKVIVFIRSNVRWTSV